jgi:hypothetical protein
MVVGDNMGMTDYFKNDDEKKKKEQEKKMDELGLFEWEKDEVRNSDYNPDNFEDDELEEDDYYYDDE